MSDKPTVGVVYPVAYRLTDHLTVPYVNLPSTIIATPRNVWLWAAQSQLTWLVVASERAWKDVLPTVPHHLGQPVYLGHLHYGDVHGWYAPTPDDLTMLEWAVGKRWWPEQCVTCGAELACYDEWALAWCDEHRPAGRVCTPF